MLARQVRLPLLIPLRVFALKHFRSDRVFREVWHSDCLLTEWIGRPHMKSTRRARGLPGEVSPRCGLAAALSKIAASQVGSASRKWRPPFVPRCRERASCRAPTPGMWTAGGGSWPSSPRKAPSVPWSPSTHPRGPAGVAQGARRPGGSEPRDIHIRSYTFSVNPGSQVTGPANGVERRTMPP